jgi:tetratricopeptide (TPR) repeat protein
MKPGSSSASALAWMIVLASGLTPIGCVSALKEPRPIPEIAGGGAPPDEGSLPAGIDALLAQAGALFAERGPDAASIEKVRLAARTYLRAAAMEGAPIESLLGAARVEVWLTDHETEPARREEAARAAVEAAQWCGRMAPGDPACDYWLGAALGVQARERPATALSALPRIEEAFGRARDARPELDEGGPDRALALLYLRAPGWPTGPGDSGLGLRHAHRALALRPDYPPNLLAIAEAFAAQGDAAESREAYRRALALSRDRALGGDRDAPEWVAEAEKALLAK